MAAPMRPSRSKPVDCEKCGGPTRSALLELTFGETEADRQANHVCQDPECGHTFVRPQAS